MDKVPTHMPNREGMTGGGNMRDPTQIPGMPEPRHENNPVDNVIVENPEAYAGKALIALTESPNYSIYSWASKIYESEGNIRRMVNTGFHDDKVWFSVIFQMMTALYVLQLHGIGFHNFKIQDNVYVKDLHYHDNMSTYWKYKIDGIEYYIPNYGHLVLIDSNFKEVEKDQFTLVKINDKKRKIYSNIYAQQGGNKVDESSLNEICYNAFENSISPNVFSSAFTRHGGTKPPESVIKLLSAIYNEATSKKDFDIGKYIATFMRRFMNNRVGTYLTESEAVFVRKDDSRDFFKGQIVVYETQYDTYKFVAYLGPGADSGKAIVATKEERNKEDIEDIIDKEVPLSSLYNYSRYESISQKYKTGEIPFNEEGLLETYVISK